MIYSESTLIGYHQYLFHSEYVLVQVSMANIIYKYPNSKVHIIIIDFYADNSILDTTLFIFLSYHGES